MDKCAKGYICINNFNVLGYIIVGLRFLYYFNKISNERLYKSIQNLENDNHFIKSNLDKNKEDILKTKLKQEKNDLQNQAQLMYDTDSVANINDEIYINRDKMAINDQLYPPFKRNYHMNPSSIQKVMPINIETRPSAGDFQQIGMLHKESISDDSKKPGNNDESNILALFGKQTYKGSNRWLYYTSSDKNNGIKIPLTYKNRDCTDDQGCDEIYDGEIVDIPSYNGNFKVKMYKFDKPRYIPFI